MIIQSIAIHISDFLDLLFHMNSKKKLKLNTLIMYKCFVDNKKIDNLHIFPVNELKQLLNDIMA
jgi:hypothetical protein